LEDTPDTFILSLVVAEVVGQWAGNPGIVHSITAIAFASETTGMGIIRPLATGRTVAAVKHDTGIEHRRWHHNPNSGIPIESKTCLSTLFQEA
jgi:hypothetical protein